MSDTRKDILRAATAMHNACMKVYKAGKCYECPFSVSHGCDLYTHPIGWQEKLKSAKNN